MPFSDTSMGGSFDIASWLLSQAAQLLGVNIPDKFMPTQEEPTEEEIARQEAAEEK
jgi:hypothetical protein